MKEITLPLENTFSFTMDLHNPPLEGSIEVDGKLIIPLGNFDFAKDAKIIEMARLNGGKILYAATSIEKKLEEVILLYFFGVLKKPNSKRDFFANEVLKASDLTFSYKKELVHKILNESKIINGKKKDNLQRGLKEIMKWRNAFAHGTLQYDKPSGCFIRYYSSGNKILNLEDKFWDLVESTFVECDKILKLVIQKLGEG